MIKTSNLGFPRIGKFRELKKATESYWKDKISKEELIKISKEIKKSNWETQKNAGINYIPSNDFSFYDQILDMISTIGAIPDRFNHDGGKIDLNLYFAMARGMQKDGIDVTAMEMTKWFDTNYHFIVPEFKKNQKFKLSSTKIIDEYLEAKNLGIETKPVIIGPMSLLLLSKMDDEFNPIDLIDGLLIIYKEIFKKLKDAGVKDIQIDEPCLVTDLSPNIQDKYVEIYAKIREMLPNIKLHLATYFDSLHDNKEITFLLKTDIIHIDLVRAPDQLNDILPLVKDNQSLSLGLIDGRNIWINKIEDSIEIAKKAIEKLGSDRVIIAPSCSLLHCPVDLHSETNLNDDIKSWLSFATQKLDEISLISRILSDDLNEKYQNLLDENKLAQEVRKTSNMIHSKKVKEDVNNIKEEDLNRNSSYKVRKKIQEEILKLPILPITTIGSFPQTKEVRKYRADFKAGRISPESYQEFLEGETKKCVEFQEKIDLDVLVHGEFERNDMVEYFGEKLGGYIFTKFGWVQSYGTRCVKPPIIFGDIYRKSPMTIDWITYAQKLTNKPMKAMLTGPITMLQWSFVRDDQQRKDTAIQIALAIREEVKDLENAGIKIIQIDEAALREGLPIRKIDWDYYLGWAVDAFRLTASIADDKTQIHTHMCYSEFNDIISSIADMDADVISIETSRSKMELLDSFVNFKYPNDIGPGVYDIHSPRVPSKEEITDLLNKALKVLKKEQIWVNPDCGLKTRDWKEVEEALGLMVESCKEIRKKIN